jgi:hypothetical protein
MFTKAKSYKIEKYSNLELFVTQKEPMYKKNLEYIITINKIYL